MERWRKEEDSRGKKKEAVMEEKNRRGREVSQISLPFFTKPTR